MKNDSISRQGAIDHWRLIIDATSTDSRYNMGFVDGLEFCISHLSTMPSAQPERKPGEWIYDGDCYICNQCKSAFNWWADSQTSNFCPNCGSYNGGGEIMSMNKYGGVNDMPNGYTKTEYGKRIYMLWFDMLRRCYDEKQLERKRGKSYADVIVCDRWLYLKNFAEDVAKLDGYDQWLFGGSMALDKDLSVQVATKVYSPTTCKFVTVEENLREMNERCKTTETAREFVKTKYVLFKGDEYHVFDTEKDACEFLGVKQCSVAGAWRDKGKCKGWNVIRIGNSADMRDKEGAQS